MCLESRTSANGVPMADDLHWAACCRLVCVEGFTAAMYSTSSRRDPTLFPWLFLLLLDLTVAYYKPDASCPETSPDDGTVSVLYTGNRTHARQLQKLGEMLVTMCNDWSPWSNLLPSIYYDASAQKHILTQLLKCITSASKVKGLSPADSVSSGICVADDTVVLISYNGSVLLTVYKASVLSHDAVVST